ncbi:MAG TPA: hypothetical protein GX711_08360 [Clostridia bacterium]|nr:hypothetical protein [Clostridia bacterium]
MNEQAAAKPKNGPRFWLVLALVLVLVAVATGIGVYFFARDRVAGAQEVKQLPVYQLPLKPFTVNLADSNFRRYLRVQITIEVNKKSLISELNSKEYRARDTIISLLSGKQVTELEEKENLRLELVEAINGLLDEGEIAGVYFEEFIIQ